MHCAARVRHQHMGLLMFRKENNIQKCHICSSPPGIREHGSLSFGKPLSQLSLVFQGSKDFNPRSATPSDVRGNRRIIISLADHGEAIRHCFFSRIDRSVQLRAPLTGAGCMSWRFSDHAFCSGNVPPCWIFDCQGSRQFIFYYRDEQNPEGHFR